MSSIREIQDEIIEEFQLLEGDREAMLFYLMELGDKMETLDEEYKTEDNIIKGCQSKVWLHADLVDGKIQYQADSDAIIVKGIVALLVKVLNGRTPSEIVNNELFFIEDIGLRQNLSPTRSNGLLAMVKKMRLYALAYQTQESKSQKS